MDRGRGIESGRFYYRAMTTAIILVIPVLAQLIFISLPSALIIPFNRLVRPTLFASMAIIYFIYTGREEHSRPHGGQAVILSVIGGILYFTAVFITGIITGFGRNAMFGAPLIIIENIWIYVTVAFFSEYIRFNIIKNAPQSRKRITAVTAALVYTFLGLDTLRNVFGSDIAGVVDFFFAIAFPVLVLNIVLSYMALEGSFPSLLIIRGVFGLSTVFLPVLPDCPQPVWSVVTCGVLLTFLIIYHFNIKSQSRSIRTRLMEKRQAKYRQKSKLVLIIPAVALTLLIAFGMRVFPYYPVTIVTGSMSGTLEVGSMAIIRKVTPEKANDTVIQGDVLHFSYRSVEMIHRVIDFRYNNSGELIYITKGDANPYADPNPVESEQVLGIFRAHIPYVGYPYVFLSALFD